MIDVTKGSSTLVKDVVATLTECTWLTIRNGWQLKRDVAKLECEEREFKTPDKKANYFQYNPSDKFYTVFTSRVVPQDGTAPFWLTGSNAWETGRAEKCCASNTLLPEDTDHDAALDRLVGDGSMPDFKDGELIMHPGRYLVEYAPNAEPYGAGTWIKAVHTWIEAAQAPPLRWSEAQVKEFFTPDAYGYNGAIVRLRWADESQDFQPLVPTEFHGIDNSVGVGAVSQGQASQPAAGQAPAGTPTTPEAASTDSPRTLEELKPIAMTIIAAALTEAEGGRLSNVELMKLGNLMEDTAYPKIIAANPSLVVQQNEREVFGPLFMDAEWLGSIPMWKYVSGSVVPLG